MILLSTVYNNWQYNLRPVHSKARNSSDNLPSHPPDSHHISDSVYRLKGRG